MKNKSTLGKFRMIFKNWKIIFTAILLFSSALFFAQITQTFNTPGNGSWTVPPNVTSITVEAWGGGGGGGGSSTDGSRGSGGGSGGYSMRTYAVIPGDNITYTIGSGGARGSSGNNDPGGTGGTTTILNLTANGGTGGVRNNSLTVGAGGTATGGTSNTTGNPGNRGNATLNGGYGGNAPANGGLGGAGTTNGVGGNGGSPGGGGGGGERDSRSRDGGLGGPGGIKITYIGYCTPVSSSSGTYINSVSTIGGISDFSNANSGVSAFPYGYQNFYDTHAMTINPAGSFTVQFNVQGGQNSTNTGAAIWIDWNKDNVFQTSERFYSASGMTNGNKLTPIITVPTGISAGNYVMRIVLDFYNGSPDSCGFIPNGTTTRGEAEDYKIIIPPPCSGTPTGGTAAIAPGTGAPSSTFNASVTGSTTGFSGLTYQWETSPTGTAGSWTPISGATTAAATITAVDFATTTYYRRKITCSGNSAYSDVKTYVTEYCTPSVGAGNEIANYIFTVAFRGTITEASNTSLFSSAPLGYQDFTGLANKAVQAQGGAVNVFVETVKESRYKAWIDWNKNGNFEDAGERVYNAGGIGQYATTFGFIIPAGTIPGDYRIRIRMSQNNATFGSCGNLNDDGETEDYLFTVVANCWSMISLTKDGTGCAGEPLELKAEATGTVSEFRWYDAETGGNLVHTSINLGGGKTTWSPILTSTTTYYVAAWSGSCGSLVRVPVKAFVKPVPTITFIPSSASACGDNSIIALSASGSSQTSWLINDNFQASATDLGNFIAKNETNNPAVNTKTIWRNRSSIYVADGGTLWTPAISSGAQGNRFVMTTSEVGGFYDVNTTLTSVPLNTTGFTSLYLKFKMYYSRYFADDFEPTKDFVKVQYSDNGAPWQDLALILRDVGTATKFEYPVPFYDLSAFKNKTNFRIRFLYHADEWCDGVAIDDVELYGDTPLETSFSWTYDNPIKFYSDELATTEYTAGNTASIIYIKPDDAQIAAYNTWNINATVNLTNGCKAVGSFTLNNDTKVWEPSSSLMTNWNDVNTWKPSVTIPDNTKCVVIRKPVSIGTGISAEAKNIKIETGGKITIDGSLKISNEIKNTLTADQFTVNSDANVLQVNDAAVNSGNITVIRTSPMTKNNYTYWSSPVSGTKTLYDFSPLTATTRFYEYIESTNLFKTVPKASPFIPGKGYAIMAPSTYTYAQGIQNFEGKFIGVPTNGTKKVDTSNLVFPLSLSAGTNQGYNMMGNPYASNINFDLLYGLPGNSSKIYQTAYFWTNVDPNRPGSTNGNTSYSGNAYAIYNGTGGVSPTSIKAPGEPIETLPPTNIIKVGQGFIVKAKASGDLIFNNSIRTSANTRFYSKEGDPGKDRFWINLLTPAQNVNTILIGYVPNATNDFEWDFDAKLFSVGSDSFYSILGENKLGIQGRTYPLNKTDVVQLGVKNFEAGTYTISLGDKQGIFANEQSIYLKDKSLGIFTDLTLGDYTFSSELGEFTNRFEIVYEPQGVLATDGTTKEELIVYKDGGDFVVKAQSKKIADLQVFDMNGRLLLKIKPNATKAVIPATTLVKGVYLLKIDQGGKVTTKKVIR